MSPAVVAVRTLGLMAGRSLTSSGRWLLWQWPAIICLLVALGFCATTLAVRLYDRGVPTIDEDILDDQMIGIFADARTISSLRFQLEPAAVGKGIQVPDDRWSLELRPGEMVHGTVTLVLLDSPGLWDLNITDAIEIVMRLPVGAELESPREPLRVNSEGTCASWWDGSAVHYARPRVQRDNFGGEVVLTCVVPKVGQVSDLYFNFAFRWPDQTWTSAGFERHSGWMRFVRSEPEAVPLGNIDVPRVRGGSFRLSRPLELQLVLAEKEALLSAFPEPTGGALGKRQWMIDGSADIGYTIERPRERAWVQLITELSLLLAGVAFGLLPSVWRRRESNSATKKID
jgi:hypothetical protein